MNHDATTKVLRALNSFNPEGTLNSEHTWAACSCPLAPKTHTGSGQDRNPSMMVSTGAGVSVAKCLSCGFSGGFKSLVRRSVELGLTPASLADDLIMFITGEELRQFHTIKKNYVPDIPAFIEESLYRPHPYYRSRGLTDGTVTTWGMGFDEEIERALIPFFDIDGSLVGAIGRDLSGNPDVPKYKMMPQGFPYSQYLFGEHLLTGRESSVLVVEGYLDAPSASQYLPPEIGVVAIGTAIPSTEQLRRMVAVAPEIILGLDNDEAGEKGYTKAKDFLLGRVELSRIDYGEHKDANDAGEGIVELVENRQRGLLLNPLLDQLELLGNSF